MKNQYVGDIGDYGKYGLLRFLASNGIKIGVNWYLTEDDGSTDGKFVNYLTEGKGKDRDPELFEALRNITSCNEKTIRISNQRLWARARDELVRTVESLGFPAELGEAIARHLGSPKAIDRMNAYLRYEKPKSEELVVDEMLAIRSEIDAWREKKASEQANARYNEILNNGLDGFDEEHSGNGVI